MKIPVMHGDGSVTYEEVEIIDPVPPAPQEPTDLDILKSQVTYTAMRTGTLIQQPARAETPAPKARMMTMAMAAAPKSPMYEQIRQWYAWGLWTADMVQEAVPSLLTQAEADEILGVSR